MSLNNIRRAGEHEEYGPRLARPSLPAPKHVMGLIELADAELSAAAGGQERCEDWTIPEELLNAVRWPPDEEGKPYEAMGGEGRGEMHQTQTQDQVNCSSTAGTPDAPSCDVDTCAVYDTDYD